jgi:hypothetical protein
VASQLETFTKQALSAGIETLAVNEPVLLARVKAMEVPAVDIALHQVEQLIQNAKVPAPFEFFKPEVEAYIASQQGAAEAAVQGETKAAADYVIAEARKFVASLPG